MTMFPLPTRTVAGEPTPTRLTISSDDGRELLSIHGDGTVAGAIEDASAAASVFVREIRRQLHTTVHTGEPTDERGELLACAMFADGTRNGELVPLADFTRHRIAAALRKAAGIDPEAPRATLINEEVTRELDRIFGVQTVSPVYDEAKLAEAKFKVDSRHHFHGVTCLCGFASDRSRSRTEHITDALVAHLTEGATP